MIARPFGAPGRGRMSWAALSAGGKPAALAVALAAAFLAFHLPFLASTPGSIDSVNFILGVRDFDVSDHRPHPPGYPLFIGLGKFSRAALGSFRATESSVGQETRALALWSALFGAAAIFPLFQFFRCLEMNDRLAIAAAALVVSCPLFWFTAIRPMSDIPGLAVALGSQALLAAAFRRQAGEQAAGSGPHDVAGLVVGSGSARLIVAGAFVSAIAIGFRSQAAWLTLPLLFAIGARQSRADGARIVWAAGLAFGAGLLLWLVPLFIASGGPSAYLAALSAQGHEDLAGVDLLVTNPTARRLARGLIDTTAFPWADRRLAPLVLGLALVGFAAMVARSRIGLALLLAASGPYAVFHLLFQDSIKARYALPLVPAVAYLAVRGLDAMARRAMAPAVAALVAACLAVAVPPVMLYARTGSPTFQALADVREHLWRLPGEQPVVAEHHAIARALRGEEIPARVLASPPKHEWLELVRYWRDEGDAPVWFLAEPGRTDLALIDPARRRLIRSYRWPFGKKFLRGVRPDGLDWYEIAAPGWFAAEGWALTPEMAGVAASDGRRPGERPIVAFVRRRPEASVLMIGGRHVGATGELDVRLEASLDGRSIDSWIATTGSRCFLRMQRLPPGTLVGASRHARLEIRAYAHHPKVAAIAIEQFDLQSISSVVYGFGSGWHEQEYDPDAGRLWRWTDARATLRVHNAGRDLTLRVVAEVPWRYLSGPPTVSIRAGKAQLARFRADRRLDLQVSVPSVALSRSAGLLTLETDRTFVPHEVVRNGDRRRLGLRVYQLQLNSPLKFSGTDRVDPDRPGRALLR